jgi:hypothetical protein
MEKVNVKGISDLIWISEKVFGISNEQLKGKGRKSEVVEMRHIIFYLASDVLVAGSLKYVGRQFNKDHSSVIHGRDRIRDIINNPKTNKTVYETYLKFTSLCDFYSSKPKVLLINSELLVDILDLYHNTVGSKEDKNKVVFDYLHKDPNLE